MRNLVSILLAPAGLSTASAALPLVGNFDSLHQATAVPEPATNVLLIFGLVTVTGLAIFLGKKIG